MSRTRKTYPLLKWFLILSAVIVVVGLFQAKVFSGADEAQGYEIQTGKLLVYIGIAAVLPFLALFFPRRETVTMELPTDHLAKTSRQDLQGILDQLERAHKKGELTDERYEKARAKVLAQVDAKKRK